MNNPPSILTRLKSAVNIFLNRDIFSEANTKGFSSGNPGHRRRLTYGNEKSIVAAIYNRISIDVASVKFRHIRTDDNDNFVETIDSGLNRCLSLEANIDQSHRAFFQDAVISMFDEGTVALVPVDTSISLASGSFDILSLRTAKIVQWYPQHVRLSIYNDRSGMREEIVLPKTKVAIIENPLYSVVNERNSIGQRLISKLNLLDAVDEQSGSGKLDLIIQLPYVIKSEARQAQAEKRRKDIESQLKDSKYGIAYTDGTEKVTQLNRSAENNLMGQIEYLTRMLYSQLGMNEKILDGTASEEEMLNYYNMTVEPIASAIAAELKRKFLTQTAITQKQSVNHFRNMFGMMTAASLADLADKLTRNEIASSNDMRSIIGWQPSKAPGANDLRNKNIAAPTSGSTDTTNQAPIDVTNEFNRANVNN